MTDVCIGMFPLCVFCFFNTINSDVLCFFNIFAKSVEAWKLETYLLRYYNIINL